MSREIISKKQEEMNMAVNKINDLSIDHPLPGSKLIPQKC